MTSSRRNPLISFLLTILTPGLGQIYNSLIKKGLGIYLLLVFLEFIVLPLSGIAKTFSGMIFFLVLVFSIFIYAAIDAVRVSKTTHTVKDIRFSKRLIILIVTINIGFYLIFDFGEYLGIKSFRIPTTSSEPVMLLGDFFIADLDYYDDKNPNPNELVLFQYPLDPKQIYLKRCIAAGGQTVEIKDKQVFVDGSRLQDSAFVQYIDPMVLPSDHGKYQYQSFNNLGSRDNFGPVKVPEGRYFMLGDNRDNSSDSRHWGFVSKKYIKGRPLYIYYSWDSAADNFFDRMRLDRIGNKLK